MPKKGPIRRSHLEDWAEEGLRKLSRKYKFTVDYESEALFYTKPQKQQRYTPDFIVKIKDNASSTDRTIFIETKGYLRDTDRTKLLAAKRCNPDADIRLIFQQDNKIPRSKMRYSDWCKKHGFPYSIKTIPIEWFE